MRPDAPKKPPAHLVECDTVGDVEAWLKDHAGQWHYGAMKAGCQLCEMGLAKLTKLEAAAGRGQRVV